MNKCPNCQKQLSCSCQIRVATDGTKVCSSCITTYEVNNKNLSVINAAVLPSS